MMNSQPPPAPIGMIAVAAQPGPQQPAATVVTATNDDIVDVWGMDSFPASDPPTNW
jgi:hypothetical protein